MILKRIKRGKFGFQYMWVKTTEEKRASQQAAATRHYAKPGKRAKQAARRRAYVKETRAHQSEIARLWRENNRERDRLTQWRAKGIPIPTRPRPDKCEICFRKPRRTLHLDHCHITKTFRGWLCDRCNLGIGQLCHSITVLSSAHDYLLRHEASLIPIKRKAA